MDPRQEDQARLRQGSGRVSGPAGSECRHDRRPRRLRVRRGARWRAGWRRMSPASAGPLTRRAVHGRPVQPDLQAGHAGPRLCAASQAARAAAQGRTCRRARGAGAVRRWSAPAFRSRTSTACARTTSVIGTWFYVMDMVEGRIFWDATIPDVTTAESARLFRRDERHDGAAPRHRSRQRSASPITAGRAITSPGRSRAGHASISTMPTPGATRTWTGWSNGCPPISPRATRPRSSMATFASTT